MSRLRPLILVVALALPFSARAAAYSAVDGSSLGADTTAFLLYAGVPNIGVKYWKGNPGGYDFGFGGSFNYARTTTEMLFLVRYAIADGERFNLAFVADGGLHLNFGARYAVVSNAANAGLRMSPGINLGMKPNPSYTTYFTLSAPFLWSWRYKMGYQLPLLMGLGLEYMITADLNLITFGSFGPRFEGGGGYVGGTFAQAEIWMGFTMRQF